ncbi:MAG: hypothetical protein HY027_20005 [Deltaproteobacteria bacterium]|nr:hypothetical protein [Deltaproteobacteria bacterium]
MSARRFELPPPVSARGFQFGFALGGAALPDMRVVRLRCVDLLEFRDASHVRVPFGFKCGQAGGRRARSGVGRGPLLF